MKGIEMSFTLVTPTLLKKQFLFPHWLFLLQQTLNKKLWKTARLQRLTMGSQATGKMQATVAPAHAKPLTMYNH